MPSRERRDALDGVDAVVGKMAILPGYPVEPSKAVRQLTSSRIGNQGSALAGGHPIFSIVGVMQGL